MGRGCAESEVGAAVRFPVRRDAASIGLALGDEEMALTRQSYWNRWMHMKP